MKTLNQFLQSRKEETQQQEVVEESIGIETIEAEDLPSIVFEGTDGSHPNDPPNVLVMRRKSIRQFPNGQRVALYYVDKINKYVTVPYSELQVTAAEQFNYVPQTKQEMMESTLNNHMTLKNFSGHLREDVIKVFRKLNEENKKQFVDLFLEDSRQVLDFVKKNK